MIRWSKYILFVFPMLTAISCNSSSDSDYRDEFIGEYFGTRTHTSWNLGGPNNTTQSLDTVLVVMVGDSSVRIDGTEIMINPNGSFFQQGGGSVSSYYSAEFFNGDSLITDQNSGGLGGGSRTAFSGKK